ncbi:RAD9, HUS1, RAD1-interacting nuclear orphan protein 1 [Polymixia lowei]
MYGNNVSPQFEQTHLAASPVRRGRRRCESATSILNGCSQLSRKTSVCKFPSLSFERRTRDRAHQPKHTGGKRAAESAFVSGSGNQQQVNGTVSHPSVQRLDTPKRQCTAIRKRNRKDTGSSECTASSSKCLDQLEASYPSNHAAGRHTIPTLSASTPPSASLRTPNANSVFTPPDVDTPEVPPEVGSCPSPHFLKLLLPLSQSSTPPDILVADTPERDYGVKVTWRRRRGLMMLLKERGHLSNSDGPIHS